jgi:hypothetical protein
MSCRRAASVEAILTPILLLVAIGRVYEYSIKPERLFQGEVQLIKVNKAKYFINNLPYLAAIFF